MKFKDLSDIFEAAIRIERHSVELYGAFLGKIDSSRAREVFSMLAVEELIAEERIHLARLGELLKSCPDGNQDGGIPSPSP